MVRSAPNAFMALALAEARAAAERGEVPVGAVVVDRARGAVLAAAGNRTEELSDPTAHAEILVLRAAAALQGAPRLEGCDLYVTLEPCPMCATAISFARVERLCFGAYDPKGGGVEHGPRIFEQPTCHHRPQVVGGMEERVAADLLRAFFRPRRQPARHLHPHPGPLPEGEGDAAETPSPSREREGPAQREGEGSN